MAYSIARGYGDSAQRAVEHDRVNSARAGPIQRARGRHLFAIFPNTAD